MKGEAEASEAKELVGGFHSEYVFVPGYDPRQFNFRISFLLPLALATHAIFDLLRSGL